MPYYPQSPEFSALPDSVSDAMLSNMPDGTVKGRAAGAGTGDPTDLTGAQVAALLPAGSINSIAPLSYRNILGRNGGFEVWQRGAGESAVIAIPASSWGYTADGWFLTGLAANQASTVTQIAGLTPTSRYAARIQRNSGQTGVSGYTFEYPLDTDEIAPMRGQVVTLSLTLSAGANFSAAGSLVQIQLYTGTGAPARRSAAVYTGDTKPIDVSQAITSTATRYSFTSSVAVNGAAAQASLVIIYTPVGTAGAADSFEIDDAQLEIGTQATPFERRPFEQELLACRRHFQKSFGYATAPLFAAGNHTGESITQLIVAGAAQVAIVEPWSVVMRAAPTMTLYNPGAANGQTRNQSASLDHSATNALLSERRFLVSSTSNPAGVATHQVGIHWIADAGI